ncbi:uncharacterized protein LOC111408520 [Olea europaea var. sylvestris]|uniref:uncharacterized protein LOC111408520 n=1 Tax=Olea europaea var. sylvestris TaxID=158386 RepID=UPI000C1D8A17|nr:uncharacterized protein LOC111408520 [Olea europaea var. sylvestris]
MDHLKDLDDNLDVFNKLLQDIINCDEAVSETYKVIILLNTILDSYKEVKSAIKYGKDTLTPEIVIDFFRSKEMEIRAEKYDNMSSELHMIRGRTQFRQNSHDGYQNGCESSGNQWKNKGKGKLKIKKRDEVNVLSSTSEIDNGEVYILPNPVAYIVELNLTANSHMYEWILDSGRLEKDDFTSKIENGMLKMIKGTLVFIKGTKKNDIYITIGKLTYVDIKGLKLLNEKCAFGNDCVSNLSFCDHCVLGKHHKISFPSSIHKAKSMLEYVHSDLWGPASNPTSGENRKRQVKNQTGKKIKFLKTDNGLEFYNMEFDSMCKKNSITRHKTVPYTPQQNEVAERMNETILDKSERKLELRARKCIFLGYLEGVMVYRLWDRSQKGVKIIVIRDVTFNENEMSCIKGEIEPVSEIKPGKERYRFKVELGKLSTPVHITPNEVEIQVQEHEMENDNEVVIEKYPKEENPLAHYI